MSTLATLTTSIESIIQDDSITDITNRINDCISMIAAGVRMPDGQISPPLPDLYSMSTVDTTENAYVSLPVTYQRNVFMVVDDNGDRIFAPNGGDYYSFMLFLKHVEKKDLSESSSVYRVCVKGSNLYYQGIPSVAETLAIHFYRLPVDMSEGTNTPDGIPSHLQNRLIVNYVAGDIMGGQIEDGENSLKMGATYHINEFYKAMTDFIDFVGIQDAEPSYYASGNDFFEDGAICD